MIPNRYTLFAALAAALAVPCLASADFVEWDDLAVYVEINASDGDIGFHGMADAGAWHWLRIIDPEGQGLLAISTAGGLKAQGVTEKFFESDEPLCEFDEEEPDEAVQSLADFLLRFPEGDYKFIANNHEGDRVRGYTELTYNLPAAPDISMTAEFMYIWEVVVEWSPGTDLGEKCHDQALVDAEIIADPSEVEIVAWEVVIEPEDDEAVEPNRTYAVQLDPDRTSLPVPVEYFWEMFEDEVTEFKFEVGAIEASGNRTFSEGTFSIDF